MHEQLNQCILNEVTCVHGCLVYNFPRLNDIDSINDINGFNYKVDYPSEQGQQLPSIQGG